MRALPSMGECLRHKARSDPLALMRRGNEEPPKLNRRLAVHATWRVLDSHDDIARNAVARLGNIKALGVCGNVMREPTYFGRLRQCACQLSQRPRINLSHIANDHG